MMERAVSSRTALSVALRRAVHPLHDSPVIFDDPITVSILGATYAARLQDSADQRNEPFSIAMRAFLVARSRYAEENLSRAVAAGVNQYVQLGAGLDTFAYRNPHFGLRIFEVDHPATQRWKRDLLYRSSVPMPSSLSYTPVDFERQSLSVQLQVAGFNTHAPAFFAWLGVVPYLTGNAFRATLAFIASQSPGSGLTFDYGQPRAVLAPGEQLARDSLASRVELAGEPFQLFFTPADVASELSSGFHGWEDLGATEINARYFRARTDQLAVRGSSGRLVSAWR